MVTVEPDKVGSIHVLNLQTDEIIQITRPEDTLYNYAEAWSPKKPYLAILSGDVQPGNGLDFEQQTHLILRVYNVETAQLIGSFRNVTFPNWSPDGAKFLYHLLDNSELYLWESPPCTFVLLSGNSTCYTEAKIQNFRASFSSLSWVPDQSTISYIYFYTNREPHDQEGGFCLISTANRSIRCMLEEFPDPDQNIIDYQWSPDGRYISFQYDTSCPLCDYWDHPQLGIAEVRTGQYLTVGNFVELGLWRPNPER